MDSEEECAVIEVIIAVIYNTLVQEFQTEDRLLKKLPEHSKSCI